MTELEKRFWANLTERRANTIADAAGIIFVCVVGMALTAIAAWLW